MNLARVTPQNRPPTINVFFVSLYGQDGVVVVVVLVKQHLDGALGALAVFRGVFFRKHVALEDLHRVPKHNARNVALGCSSPRLQTGHAPDVAAEGFARTPSGGRDVERAEPARQDVRPVSHHQLRGLG